MFCTYIVMLQSCNDEREAIKILLTIPDDKIAILRKIVQLIQNIIIKENINKLGIDDISKEICPCLFHQDEKYIKNLFEYLLGKTNNTPKDPSPKLNSELQNKIFHWIMKYSDVIISGDSMKLEKGMIKYVYIINK